MILEEPVAGRFFQRRAVSLQRDPDVFRLEVIRADSRLASDVSRSSKIDRYLIGRSQFSMHSRREVDRQSDHWHHGFKGAADVLCGVKVRGDIRAAADDVADG